METTHRIPLPCSLSTEPEAVLGDTLWANYQVSAEVRFSDDPAHYYGTFAGIGLRFRKGAEGFTMFLYPDGGWELRYGEEILKNGTVPGFSSGGSHRIGIGAMETIVFCFADGHSLGEVQLTDRPIVRSGGVKLLGQEMHTSFCNVTAQALPAPVPSGCYRVGRELIRTAENGTVHEIRFYGSGISLLGRAETARAAFWLDEKLWSDETHIAQSRAGEAFFTITPLKKSWHTLRMQVLSGSIEPEAAEIPTDDTRAVYDVSAFPPDPLTQPKPSLLKKAAPIAGAAAGAVLVAALGVALRKKK